MEKVITDLLAKFEKELSLLGKKEFFHPRLGLLSHPESVVLKTDGPGIKPDQSTIFHVTITGRCNARCEGCINVSLTCNGREKALSLFEAHPEREAQAIWTLSQGARRPITVAFYGGEPLLALEKMSRLQSLLRKKLGSEVRFMVYTNGMLLDQALVSCPDFWSNLWLLSVSIDGSDQQHEAVRRGTKLSVIRQNLALLKERHPQVKVLFWSTLREGQSLLDCFQEFLRLYDAGLIDYFFYHFAETDRPFHDFGSYLQRYEEDFSTLLEIFTERLRQGEFLPIVHLAELLSFMLSGHRRGHTACGAELAANFDLVGGRILACADLPPEMALGEVLPNGRVVLKNTSLELLAAYKGFLGCLKCGLEPYCGGRCPVQALTGSVARTREYCLLLRLHVGLVKERVPQWRPLLKQLSLAPQKLYDQLGFLARYTDVIP